jgi:hypothetical protein
MKVTLEKEKMPRLRNMKVRFQFEGEINISPYIAQQKVNQFLIMKLPNLIMADEPDFELTQGGGFWRVPVVLTNPADGIIGKVGEIIVDASTGIIERQRSTSLEEIERNAESIAQ